MATQQDGLQARQDYIEAQNEYGSDIIIWQETQEVWDDDFENIITPAVKQDYPQKAFVKNVATDKILAKLTDNEKQSYSLYLKFYTDQPINKEDYRIEYKGLKYAITFIDSSQIQNIIYKYETLLAR